MFIKDCFLGSFGQLVGERPTGNMGRERNGYDIQQRSLTGLEPGTLWDMACPVTPQLKACFVVLVLLDFLVIEHNNDNDISPCKVVMIEHRQTAYSYNRVLGFLCKSNIYFLLPVCFWSPSNPEKSSSLCLLDIRLMGALTLNLCV